MRFIRDGQVLKTVQAPLNVAGGEPGDLPVYSASNFDPDAVGYEYQWMYSQDGEKYYPMEFADDKTYRVSTIDKNKYIACEVTPIYENGQKGKPVLQEKGQITKLGTVSPADISAEERFSTRFSAEEYKFKLEGTDREYVLLDVFQGNKDSKYFVLSDFLTNKIEQHNLDPQNINPNDVNSVGYWLNNTFVNEGYSLAGVNWPKLEDNLCKYIDKNHKWWVEAGIKGLDPDNLSGYSYTAGIGLLTESEAVKYLGRYGWYVTTENGEWHNPWLLATGSAANDEYILVMNYKINGIENIGNSGIHYIKNVAPGTGHEELYPRPAFYLNDQFFKNVRLDINSLGSEIKKIILENYTKNELKNIYSEEELLEIGFAGNRLEIKTFEVSKGKTSAKLEIPEQPGTAVAAVYDNSGRCIGIEKLDKDEFYIEFSIEADKMKLFFWDNINEMNSLYPAAETECIAEWR